LDAGFRIDCASTHSAGANINAEEQTCHSTSPPFGSVTLPRALPLKAIAVAPAIALQHVRALQDVKKFASGHFRT
jgi:hypothetical protein